MGDPLEVHSYDGLCDPAAVAAAQNVLAHPPFDAVLQEVRACASADAAVGSIELALAAYRDLTPRDPRNDVDANDAFRLAWSLVREDEGLRQLFYLNLDDMIRTNGTCVQGRSTRMLQLIAALHSPPTPHHL